MSQGLQSVLSKTIFCALTLFNFLKQLRIKNIFNMDEDNSEYKLIKSVLNN